MSTRSVVQPRTSHSRNDGAARKNGKSFMRKSLGALTVAGLALGGSLLGATAAHATVGISDQMRTAINTWFERDPNTPITAAEAAAVLPSQYINKALNLHLTEVEVDSLAGLDAFKTAHLTAFGSFSDLSPLTEMENLNSVRLFSPNITDAPVLTNEISEFSIYDSQITDLSTLIASQPATLLGFPNSPVASLDGVEDLTSTQSLAFGGWTTNPTFYMSGTPHVWEGIDRSPIADLSPIAGGPSLQGLIFSNSSISDLTPLASQTDLQYVKGDRNFIADISALPDNLSVWQLTEQEVALPSAAVGTSIASPLTALDGSPVMIDAADAAVAGLVQASDGSWVFTSTGAKSIPFSWSNGDPVPGLEFNFSNTFSGTVTINVTEGAIVGGDVNISGTPGIGQELTADASGFEPADVDLEYEWIIDGEVVGTGSTFTPGAEHAGKDVTVNVAASKPGYNSENLTSAPVTVATPTIDVAPVPVKPGDTITITGENYAPGEEVTVTLQPGGQEVTVTADENGNFTAEVQVPADAADGDYTATAVGAESGAAAVSKFTVAAAAKPVPEASKPAPEAGKDSAQLAQTGAFSSPIFLVGAGILALLGTGLIAARAVARKQA